MSAKLSKLGIRGGPAGRYRLKVEVGAGRMAFFGMRIMRNPRCSHCPNSVRTIFRKGLDALGGEGYRRDWPQFGNLSFQQELLGAWLSVDIGIDRCS